MSLLNNIIERKNLEIAWRKVRKYLFSYDGWLDIEGIYSFEANLDKELEHIHNELSKGRWQPKKMMPLPRLKRKKLKDGNYEEVIRQDFWVPVVDQVAWAAVVNVVGPILDLQMPGWSFANRIYRSVFYEELDMTGEDDYFRIGPFRHYSENLYRSWRKSWSQYRRLAYLTLISMSKGKITTSDLEKFAEGDRKEYQNLTFIKDESQNIPYLMDNYWKGSCDEIFWAKIDLKDFFPLLNRKAVLCGIMFGLKNFNGYKNDDDPKITEIEELISQMLHFSWKDANWSREQKEQAFLNKTKKGIPVGLCVSGFLANAALLPIEIKLRNKLKGEEPKKLAHFRYVDDHIILSKDFKELVSWIMQYKDLLKGIGAKLNDKKTQPEQLGKYLIKKRTGKLRDMQKSDLTIDLNNPNQFFTQTLALMSDIAQKDFGLLHAHEQEFLFAQLKHLLLVPLEEDEIKNDTRMVFAIYRIILLIVDWQLDWTKDVMQQRDFLKKYKLNSLISKFNEPEFPNKDEYKNMIAGAFKNLLETAQQFPERLRLWRLMIEYCRKTGHEGWGEVEALFTNKIIPQYRFLRTLIWIELGQQVLNATRALKIYRNLYSWEIILQAKFLEDIDKWVNALKIDKFIEFYEEISWNYLKNCINLAKFINNGKSLRFPSTKPILYYFAEMNLTVADNTEPSQIWKDNIKKLNSADAATKSLLRLYPSATAKLSSDKFKIIINEFRKEKTAWGWEGMSSAQKNKHEFTLVDWCNWTKKFQDICNKTNLYDPRISEWTALEIMRQILAIYEPEVGELDKIRESLARKLILPHPANFLIPRDWTWKPSKRKRYYTWYDWKIRISKNSQSLIGIAPVESQVKRDDRITPFWLSDNKNDQTKQINNLLYGMGLLLMGLLRKSFNWPARWHLPAYSSDWRRISIEWFSSSACSTDTLFILQSLLLSRQAETKRIKDQPIIKYDYDDDHIYDPPLIRTFPELRILLEDAQDKLEKKQINSFNILPRQLIPVSIPKLINREWLKTELENE